MGTVIGTLTVNLEANTATFSGDLSKASGSLKVLEDDAKKTGESVDYSMGEARHGVMLLGEEFGIHIPRALTSFIASLGPIGAAMEAAFPFLAIAVGATLIIEHLVKMHEAAEKLVEQQEVFGTSIDRTFTNLDDRLLQAGIKADELRHDHMAALNKELELIDHQTLADLSKEFDVLGKAADAVFTQLKTSWYQIGEGSRGAKDALDHFKTQYDALLAQGKDKEANDLLLGTLESAKKIQALQSELNNPAKNGGEAEYVKWNVAKNELARQSIGYGEKEVAAQNALVDALQAQVTVKTKLDALAVAKKEDVTQKADNEEGADQDKMYRQQAAEAKKAADEAEKAQEEAYKRAVTAIQQAEKEKIEATRGGTKERLAAIDAAIKDENSKGLQETAFYRALQTERVQTVRKMADEELKIREGLAAELANHQVEMAKLGEKGEEEADRHKLAMHKATLDETVKAELTAAQKAYQIELDAYNKEQKLLDPAKDAVKIQAISDKKLQLEQKYYNDRLKITNKGEEQLAQSVRHGEEAMANTVARNVAKSLVESKNMADGLASLGKQILEDALANTIKMILIGDMKQAKDAGHAAASAFSWVMQDVPFPANAIIAPIAAAAAFAGVMAFEQGGEIPGQGAVPIIGHGGETVVTKALTDQVKNTEGRGGSADTNTTHYHIDARGADAGVEARLHRAIKESEQRSVARSVSAIADRQGRRS